MCGSTAAQGQILQTQQNFSQQLTQQASQVFGESSNVFNDLVSSFAPTVAAGPNQQGFSQAELSNLNSQAITTTGNEYKNAKAAAGDAASASGGNDSDVTGGTTTGIDLSVANAAGAQTSTELGQINQANYAQGNANYQAASAALAGAPGVFNPSTSLEGEASGQQENVANTANQIAGAADSWIAPVAGAVGAVAGAAAGGYAGK